MGAGIDARPIPWHQSKHGGPCGRHIEHDERSRQYAAMAAPTQLLRTTKHKRRVGIYDQGKAVRIRGMEFPDGTGSCTGNACAGALSTSPFRHSYRAESTAIGFYEAATRIDSFDGTFPPTDTGSSGLAVAQVAKARGLISRYEHAFNLQAALTALLAGPILIGVNWYDSFDRPGADGLITLSPNAQIRGGHEMEVSELLLATDGAYTGSDRVRIPQSWGYGFGDKGWIEMEIATLDRLLSEDGDATILVA